MSFQLGQTVSVPFSSRRDRNYNSLRTTKRNKIPIYKGIGDGPGQKGSEPGMIGEIMLDRTNGKFCWHTGTGWICIDDAISDDVTLSSTGTSVDADLVSDGMGPDLAVKGLVAGAGIIIDQDTETVTITAMSGDVTLTTECSPIEIDLVADGMGPNLGLKGLDSGEGIQLTDVDNCVTVGLTPTPVNLDLYVSMAGDDVTGDGTSGNPYLTIDRALLDARNYGWDDTATITILSSGGTFVFPSGEMSFNAGTRGEQNTPLRLVGDTRTTIDSGSVSSSNVNFPTTLIDIISTDVTVLPQVGDRLVFTSPPALNGVDALITGISGTLGNLQIFMALGSDQFGTPNIGATFDIERLATAVQIDGLVKIRADANTVVWEDLDVTFTGTGGLIIENTTFLSYAVNLTNDSGSNVELNLINAVWQAGLYRDDLTAGRVQTSKGLYIDNTSGGNLIITYTDGRYVWGNTGVYGNGGSPGDETLEITGQFTNTWWEGVSPITPDLYGGTTTISSAYIYGSNGAAVIDYKGTTNLNGIEIQNATGDGVTVGTNGVVTINNVHISNIGGNGVTIENGGVVKSTGLLITATIGGNSLEVRNGGTFISTDLMNLSGATGDGLRVFGDSTVFIGGNLTASNCGGYGVYVGRTSRLTTANLNASSNGNTNIFILNNSKLTSNNITVGSGAGNPLVNIESSAIKCMVLTVDGTGSAASVTGVTIASSTAVFNELDITNCTANGMNVLGESRVSIIGNSVNISSNGNIGLSVRRGAEVSGTVGTWDINNNGTYNIAVLDNSIITLLANLIATNAVAQDNILIRDSSSLVIAEGYLDASFSIANTKNGIILVTNSKLTVDNNVNAFAAINVSGSGSNGIYVADSSSIYCNGTDTTIEAINATNCGGAGLFIEDASNFTCDGRIDASSSAAGIRVCNSSVLNCANVPSGTPIDVSGSTGTGLSIENASNMTCDGRILATGSGAGIRVFNNSVLNCINVPSGIPIDVSSSTGTGLSIEYESTVLCAGTDNTSPSLSGNNCNIGLNMIGSTLRIGDGGGDVIFQNNTTDNITLTSSNIYITDENINIDCTIGGGIVTYGLFAKLGSNIITEGDIDASNTARGIEIETSTTITAKDITANNTSTGRAAIRVDSLSTVNALNITANNNTGGAGTGDGLQITESTVNVGHRGNGGLITTNGNLANGICIVSGTLIVQNSGNVAINSANNINNNGIELVSGSKLHALGRFNGTGNGQHGVSLVSNSSVSQRDRGAANGITGTSGDVKIGANAVITWATLAGGVATDRSDYATAGTELCGYSY